MSFDPERLLRTLNTHGVAYVLVGGFAAVAHGSSLLTEDIDISPARDRANLDRLAEALRELGATIRTEHEPAGVAFPCDGAFLAAQTMMLNLVTECGDLDLILAPAAFPNGYEDLFGNASAIDLGDGVRTLVASLADVIASKRAAGRTKDVAVLPHLEALAEEINRSGP